MKKKNSPFSDRSHDEGTQAGATDSNSGGKSAFLLKVHWHAHYRRQVDQPKPKAWKTELLYINRRWEKQNSCINRRRPIKLYTFDHNQAIKRLCKKKKKGIISRMKTVALKLKLLLTLLQVRWDGKTRFFAHFLGIEGGLSRFMSTSDGRKKAPFHCKFSAGEGLSPSNQIYWGVLCLLPS